MSSAGSAIIFKILYYFIIYFKTKTITIVNKSREIDTGNIAELDDVVVCHHFVVVIGDTVVVESVVPLYVGYISLHWLKSQRQYSYGSSNGSFTSLQPVCPVIPNLVLVMVFISLGKSLTPILKHPCFLLKY